MMFNAGKGEAFAWDVPQTAGICGQMLRPYIRPSLDKRLRECYTLCIPRKGGTIS